MGFPNFHNGSLLFCNGGLAASCCPGEGGSSGWNEDSGNNNDEPEPPCDPPTGPSTWEIGSLCFTEDCDGPQIPFTVGIGGEDNPCVVAGAVPTQATCNKLSCVVSAPYDCDLTVTAFTPAGIYTKTIYALKGITYTIYFDVEGSAQEEMFGDDGMRKFSARITAVNGDVRMTQNKFTYIWAYDIESYVDVDGGALTPFVVPKLYPNALNVRIKNTYGKRVYYLSPVVGAYSSSSRAAEVLNGYDDAIESYIKNCMCRIICEFDDYGCGGGDGNYETSYEGVYDTGYNPVPRSAGAFCPYSLTFSMWTSNEWCELYLECRDGEGPWTRIMGGSGDEWDYSGYVPPCREFRLWIKYEANKAFTFGVNWEGITEVGAEEECTAEIEEAFGDVPIT